MDCELECGNPLRAPLSNERGEAVGVGTAAVANFGDSIGASADRLSNSRRVSSSLHCPLSTNWNSSLSVRVGVGIIGVGVNSTGVLLEVGVLEGVANGTRIASLSGLGTYATGLEGSAGSLGILVMANSSVHSLPENSRQPLPLRQSQGSPRSQASTSSALCASPDAAPAAFQTPVPWAT